MNDETMMNSIQQIKEDIRELQSELAERKAALPAHSVQPHQLMVIEELEEEISMKQEVLNTLENTGEK
ncbi:MAG: hypothetical protein PVG39_18550 [Desulfobacteraceae bacterium]|jgi:hypothetical protein